MTDDQWHALPVPMPANECREKSEGKQRAEREAVEMMEQAKAMLAE